MPLSTFGGLNLAYRGLAAQQRALETTGHNIANANTEGYTRQEAVLTASPALSNLSVFGMILPGQLGQGVDVDSYRRIRDQYTDNNLRGQLARQGGSTVRQDALQRAELSLPEPGDNGLQSVMAKFWGSWADVAANPENSGARQALVQQAQTMASAFLTAANDLAAQRADANAQADGAVGEINALATQIAGLNDSIAKLVAVGQAPNDMLDVRDKLLDDLSRLAPTTVSYGANSVATVTVGGLTVVDPTGPIARTRAEFDAQFPTALPTGKLGGLLDVYQNVLPSYQARLDDLAIALHDDINAVHSAGFDVTGAPGGLFFANGSITSASQLAVDPALVGDARKVAAAGSAGAPGDSSNALRIIGLRSGATAPPVSALGTTYDDFYTGLISDLGVDAQTATRDRETIDAVVSALTSRRESASGVSLDEEMTNLVRFQHAFAAAGRAITTMDEMLETIVRLGQ